MKTKLALLLAVLFAVPLPVLAHHSFAAEFDRGKPVKVEGTVAKQQWTNPHIWIYVDVKNQNGTLTQWQCEGGSPNTLSRQGWSKTTLKPGDRVTIEGFRAKDGTNTCNANVVRTPEGKRLFAASSASDVNQ
ncbi:MAG: hypothetical protein HYU27_05245 [Acidobacteria bacterium]|nr:hypothetical protein [Acidobacteriota bacterium]